MLSPKEMAIALDAAHWPDNMAANRDGHEHGRPFTDSLLKSIDHIVVVN